MFSDSGAKKRLGKLSEIGQKNHGNVIKNHTEIVTNSTHLLGDLLGLAHTEKVCEKVESMIPGQATTQLYDITQGTTATKSPCEKWLA